MPISITVRNQVHADISHYTEDPVGVLTSLREKAPDRSVLACIMPHADTMLNEYQLNLLIDEIDGAPQGSDSEQKVLQDLREACLSALRHRGYLWFSGD